MATKKDLLVLAESEEGYCEKSAANYKKYGKDCLYPKAQYAGEDNYTKYGYELNRAGLEHGLHDYWCQTFINWLFWTVFGKNIAQKLLCGKLTSASTMDVKNAFNAKGRLVPLSKAEAGDIVFRSRNGGGHVGLVKGQKNGQIITIEGNTSSSDVTAWNGGCVAEHVGGYWQWCARPDWSLIKDDSIPQYTISDEFVIGVGQEGLTVKSDLNVRTNPKSGSIVKTLKTGEHIYPNRKVFVTDKDGSSPWYQIPGEGWVSAKYLEGWVWEDSVKKWWFVRYGYYCDYNLMFTVGNHEYYADETGYIVQSQWVDFGGKWAYFDRNGARAYDCYVESKSKEGYYYCIDGSGYWEPELDTPNPDLISYPVVI